MISTCRTVSMLGCLLVGLGAAAAQAQEASQAPQTPEAKPPAAKPSPGTTTQAPAAATTDKPKDDLFSISLFYWQNPGRAKLRSGKAALTTDDPSTLDYPGKNHASPGIMLSFPAGKNNSLRLSYFQAKGRGGTTAPEDLLLFGTAYDAGDVLSVDHKIQNVKVVWEYLSWPYPPTDSGFRLKTLWGVQYTALKTTIDAPLKAAADATADTFATKSLTLIYPTLGLGVEKRFSKNVRWEANGSGFAFPHRAVLWDAETFVAIRGKYLEVSVGGRAFHFKTSPQKNEYVSDTLPGAFVSLRYYFN